MGRKIPVRKHRGKVKDPLKLIERRNAEKLANSAPKNPSDQEIPSSVLEIRRLCEKAKKNKGVRKRHKNQKLIDSNKFFDKDPKLPGFSTHDSSIPRIVQLPGESKEKFLKKFDQLTEDLLLEAQLQEKHDVRIKKDQSGNVTEFAGDENYILNLSKTEKRNTVKEKNSIKSNYVSIKKKSKTKKQETTEDNSDAEMPEVDFSMYKDEVMFGEVADRPPIFSSLPRGSQKNSRPGSKDLLLKNLIKGEGHKSKISLINQEKKLNKLSISQKIIQEKNRLAAVAAYRDFKLRLNKRS